MPLVSSTGARSGLDLEGIINATLEAERVPKKNRLDQQEGRLQVELSAVGEMRSVLSKLQDAAEKLTEGSLFSAMKGSVTQPESGDVVTVESSENASAGNFDIAVTQLAKGSRAVSADGAFASADDEVNTTAGALTFGAGEQSFTLNIEAGSSLEDIRNAVNSSEDNFGVTADIINTGTEAKLVFRSSVTGAGNDLTVTNDNAEFDTISTQANAGGAGGMTIAANDQATDAIIEIDGIQATNDTNTFTDVIQGSTITAVKETEGTETAQLSISRDDAGVKKSIDTFVKAYNDTISLLSEIGGEDSMLQGDATVRSLKNQMNNVLTSTFGDEQTLFDLGFGLDKEGLLQQENPITNVSDVLKNNPAALQSVMGGENGLASRMDTLMNGYVGAGGSLQMRRDSINDSLDRVSDSREALARRMESMEETLRSKYQALDSLIGQLRDRGDYVSSQLSNLPGFTRDND
ncbi:MULTISPECIES: flagellar filament capping protein FliD [Gammaproteobacteria]|jgi:flagellar hook-associated protein 2|uniref:flagellar filament capping protein FliD n=1 Tax=Gammaproteobacteria TaxID=1236 RepID=UPI000C64EAE4|nr:MULTISPECIES: flagellar filament capping protein FliD [Gammaproteobacteria]MAD62672.1 flagellar cap protein [Haliea sp.]MAO67489.1 flagellar cap protein [Idiomarina sp.]MBF80328.1 flagellar cap protein [Idiomarina sp.]MBP57823.1 flagellar cap protein [Idiomarina sp.]|tara:strand:+ start:5569 stop:6957 length:1389 start_codon:yes stop_codon:yes gene_type:complete